MRANKTKAAEKQEGDKKSFWRLDSKYSLCCCCCCPFFLCVIVAAVLARDPLRRQVANVNCVHKLQHNCKFA